MFTELNSILDIGKEGKLSNEFLVLSDDGSVDGTFVIHHFLSLFLKSNRVCFLSLTQSFAHYQNVAKKLGTNLSDAKTENKLTFVEGLRELGNCLVGTVDNETQQSSVLESGAGNPFYHVLQNSLPQLFKHLKSKVEGLENVDKTPVTLIIDNLSVLLTIGVTVKEVLSFIHYLRAYILNRGLCSGSLVLFTNNGNTFEDEVNSSVWKYLTHSASLILEVSGLSSGYCREVHGELMITWPESTNRRKKKKKFQYKLSEKNVSFFALGCLQLFYDLLFIHYL
ncbi:hypothetical protein ScPMuIL_003713 [Solemya velum]